MAHLLRNKFGKGLGGILKFLGIVVGCLVAYLLIQFGLVFLGSRRESLRDQARLNIVLSNSGVDRLEVVNVDADKKHVISAQEIQSVMATFAATNRIPWTGPTFRSLYMAGHIRLAGAGLPETAIHYIPAHNGAAYGNYYFHLKGTNDLRRVFEWWTTNDAAPLP